MKQHKALELASHLEEMASRIPAMGDEDDEDLKAASELRRQHALIVQMREALEQIADFRPLTFAECADAEAVIGIAEIALTAANEYLEQP